MTNSPLRTYAQQAVDAYWKAELPLYLKDVHSSNLEEMRDILRQWNYAGTLTVMIGPGGQGLLISETPSPLQSE